MPDEPLEPAQAPRRDRVRLWRARRSPDARLPPPSACGSCGSRSRRRARGTRPWTSGSRRSTGLGDRRQPARRRARVPALRLPAPVRRLPRRRARFFADATDQSTAAVAERPRAHADRRARARGRGERLRPLVGARGQRADPRVRDRAALPVDRDRARARLRGIGSSGEDRAAVDRPVRLAMLGQMVASNVAARSARTPCWGSARRRVRRRRRRGPVARRLAALPARDLDRDRADPGSAPLRRRQPRDLLFDTFFIGGSSRSGRTTYGALGAARRCSSACT